MDCKDYAIHNAQQVREKYHVEPTFVLTPKINPKHIFVIFNYLGVTYVMDNDRFYRLPAGLLKGSDSQRAEASGVGQDY